MRNPTRVFTCLYLLLALLFSLPVAQAQAIPLDFSLLPEDTIAIVLSPANADQPRIIYAIHGITKDKDTVSVSVMQIPTDPQWKIYDADTDGVTEQEIRWLYDFPKDLPILGSYCEAYIDQEGNLPKDSLIWYKQDSSVPMGNNMDEQFTFLLSETEDVGDKLIFQMAYNCIPIPGAISDTPLCQMTIDLSDYLTD